MLKIKVNNIKYILNGNNHKNEVYKFKYSHLKHRSFCCETGVFNCRKCIFTCRSYSINNSIMCVQYTISNNETVII